ncbi:RTA1 like protein-domain-containing protein [Dipodascopsis uninucleata]
MTNGLFGYDPSLAAAIAAGTVFFLTTTAHLILLIYLRGWRMLSFVFGGFIITIGFVFRVIAIKGGTADLSAYIVQTILILLGPVFYVMSIYMCLSRIVKITNGERHSIGRLKWLSKFFIVSDIITLIVQAAGGGIIAANITDVARSETGRTIATAGMIIQLVSFILFFAAFVYFYVNMTREPTQEFYSVSHFERHALGMFIACIVILIRTIYRLIEFRITDPSSVIVNQEWCFYVFDAAMMAILAIALAVFHPNTVQTLDTASLGSTEKYPPSLEDSEY